MVVHPLRQDTTSSRYAVPRGRQETALQMLEGEAYGGCADCRAYDQRRVARLQANAHERYAQQIALRAVRRGDLLTAERAILDLIAHDDSEDAHAEAGDGYVECNHRRFRSIASAVEYAETGVRRADDACGIEHDPPEATDGDGTVIVFEPCMESGTHKVHVHEARLAPPAGPRASAPED
jgi:multidrug efflux pump subunit AcrA (membrane-fusion protein)